MPLNNHSPACHSSRETATSSDGNGLSAAAERTLVPAWRWFTPAGILIALIMVYRKTVAPWLPPVCRFTPTCSEYGLEAVKKHGAFRGGILIVWRLLRCQPFCRGGYDPVPDHLFRRTGKTNLKDRSE